MTTQDEKRVSTRRAVQEFLDRERPKRIGRLEMAALEKAVLDRRGRVSSREALLDVLFETDLEIDRAVGGLPTDLRDRVRTREPQASAVSLIEMSAEYAAARRASDDQRGSDCRRAVMRAKQRLRRTLARPNLSEPKRREKQELFEWFLVWLESPEIFPDWIELRLRALSKTR